MLNKAQPTTAWIIVVLFNSTCQEMSVMSRQMLPGILSLFDVVDQDGSGEIVIEEMEKRLGWLGCRCCISVR